jgi:hypothetical protein
MGDIHNITRGRRVWLWRLVHEERESALPDRTHERTQHPGCQNVLIGPFTVSEVEKISPLGRLISWYEVLCYRNHPSFHHWDYPNNCWCINMLVPEREEPEAKPAAECYPKKRLVRGPGDSFGCQMGALENLRGKERILWSSLTATQRTALCFFSYLCNTTYVKLDFLLLQWFGSAPALI